MAIVQQTQLLFVRNENEIEHDIEKTEERDEETIKYKDEENMFDFDISFGLVFPRAILLLLLLLSR